MSHRTLVVAHDGCERSIPHTLDFVLGASDAGADIIEVDIRTTRDGVVVLQHDGELSLDGRQFAIAELSFNELEDLQRAGRLAGQKILGRMTRLDEILKVMSSRGIVLNLDVKEDAVIDPTVSMLRKNGMVDRVIFSGCETRRALHLKSRCRESQVLLNINEVQYQKEMADRHAFVRSICSDAAEASCCGLNVNYLSCSKELISYAATRFLPVSVWTVDNPKMMKYFLRLGAHSITTNRVVKLRRLLSRQRRWA